MGDNQGNQDISVRYCIVVFALSSMVRVSGPASKSFIEYFALLTSFILPVLEAEQAVELVRLSLGSKTVDADQQVKVVAKTLAASKDLILRYCDEAATAWSLENKQPT